MYVLRIVAIRTQASQLCYTYFLETPYKVHTLAQSSHLGSKEALILHVGWHSSRRGYIAISARPLPRLTRDSRCRSLADSLCALWEKFNIHFGVVYRPVIHQWYEFAWICKEVCYQRMHECVFSMSNSEAAVLSDKPSQQFHHRDNASYYFSIATSLMHHIAPHVF